MSDSWSSRMDQIKSRIKDAVGNTEGEIDAETLMTRIRESVGQAASDVDTDALMARVKDVAGKAEGRVDTAKLKQWIDEVDRDKMQSWLDDAKAMTASAATVVEAQGERLAEKAPGAIDKLLGVAKETFGDLSGNEEMARKGELQHLKGDIQERLSGAAEVAEDATDKRP
ncbi:MAG: hypothetical protein ACRDJC_15475 [Thermomicrobiales bacterium]